LGSLEVWPLLDELPTLPVTAIDRDPERARDLEAVRLGGIERLTACKMDATWLKFDSDCFGVVTLLEVLEHVREVGRGVAEAARVARRFNGSQLLPDVVQGVPFINGQRADRAAA